MSEDMPKLPWQNPSVDADRARLFLDAYEPTQNDPLKQIVGDDLKTGLNRQFMRAYSGFQGYAQWAARGIARNQMMDAGSGMMGMLEGADLGAPVMQEPFFRPTKRIPVNEVTDRTIAWTLDIPEDDVRSIFDENQRQRFMHGLVCALQAEAKSRFRPTVDSVLSTSTQPEAFSENTRAYKMQLRVAGYMPAMAGPGGDGAFETTILAHVGLDASDEPYIHRMSIDPPPTASDDLVALDPDADFQTDAPIGLRGIQTNPIIGGFISEGDFPGAKLVAETAMDPMYELQRARGERPTAPGM